MKNFIKGEKTMTQHVPMVPSKEEMMTYGLIAKSASQTPYWKQLGGEGSVLSIMLLARELGISPMNAISGMIHTVQGKVELSAKGITYLIRKNGHKINLVHLTPTKCVLKGKRADNGEEMEVTYSIEDAQSAGLVRNGGGWTKNPKDMLFARAVSRLGRWLFTDCLGSCYVEGELQETIQKKTVESPEVEIPQIEETPIELELPEEITQEMVDVYVEYLAIEYDRPKKDFLMEAQKRPEAFFEKVKAFHPKEKDHSDDLHHKQIDISNSSQESDFLSVEEVVNA